MSSDSELKSVRAGVEAGSAADSIWSKNMTSGAVVRHPQQVEERIIGFSLRSEESSYGTFSSKIGDKTSKWMALGEYRLLDDPRLEGMGILGADYMLEMRRSFQSSAGAILECRRNTDCRFRSAVLWVGPKTDERTTWASLLTNGVFESKTHHAVTDNEVHTSEIWVWRDFRKPDQDPQLSETTNELLSPWLLL